MKPSSLSAILWLLALAVLGYGGFMVWDFKKGNDKVLADARAVWDQTSVEAPETWLSYRASAEANFNFPSDLRLVTGPQEEAAPKPKDPIKIGPKPPPPPKTINLAVEAERVAQEFRAQLSLQQVFLIEDVDGLINQKFSQAMFKAKYGPVDEAARNSFFLSPNTRLVENEMSYMSAGQEKPKDLPSILHDSRLVEVQAHAAIFAVNTPAFRKKYKQALTEDEAKAKKAVDENGYVRVEVKMEGEKEAAESLFDPDPTKIIHALATGGTTDNGTSGAKSGVDAYNERQLDIIRKKEEAARIAAEKARNEIPAESIIDEKGNVVMGRNDLHPGAFEGMEEYGETYIDPETNKPAGVKISRNLPGGLDQASANIIRRYGGLPGDIVKSINGVAVTDSQSIRGTVRKMRNDDVEVFNVVYIRDGAELKKTIKARKTPGGK